MLSDGKAGIKSYVSLVKTVLSECGDWKKTLEQVVTFIAQRIPIQEIRIAEKGMDGNGIFVWTEEGTNIYFQKEIADVVALFEQCEEGIIFELFHMGNLYGYFLLKREKGVFVEEEVDLLEIIGSMLECMIANREIKAEGAFSKFLMNSLLDGMKQKLYVTDVDTDEILFMNQAMKDEFKIQKPEGMVCWQVLQSGMTERCSFCPVKELKESPHLGEVIHWEEVNSFTGRIYSNYDSLIKWMDGSTVHLQQSIDITELKYANMDELTHMLSRRAGKLALEDTLQQIKKEKRKVVVALYDVNGLKEVNDTYGHAEGDYLIKGIAEHVKSILLEQEYAFRLSGDEFVVVFYHNKRNVARRLEQILEKLRTYSEKYICEFCYGLIEVSAEYEWSVETVLQLADESMYEQKRKSHIIRRGQKVDRLENEQIFAYETDYLYDALVKSTDDYMYVCNMKTGVFKYTRAMVDEFGLPAQVLDNAATVWGAKVHPEDQVTFLEANQMITDGRAAAHCVEYRAKNRNGEWVWVRCRGHLEYDQAGEPVLFAGFITNLGKKNKIDYLTGLANKIDFEEQIKFCLENEMKSFSVMALGIDDLKHINDLYDRTFGDEVIRIVSQKIQSILPDYATLYRMDGDEFVIWAKDADAVALQNVYETIYKMFDGQQEYDGKKYYSTLSAGIVVIPEHGNTYLDLIKRASYALQYAKNHGKKQCIVFHASILEYRQKDLELVELLRESVENEFEGFSLRYQPLMNVGLSRVNGLEVLARWEHPKCGQVSPVVFIPLLEQTGLIIPVGDWVIRTALKTCKPWTDFCIGFEVNINISYLQLEKSNFVELLKDQLLKSGFPTKNLVLEMTESMLPQEGSDTKHIFEQVQEMGIRIAMDDFGTGYSALGILKQAPADEVKIDRIFAKDILTSSFDATFIQFVVALCHDVGIKVCLEGVETKEEFEAVSKMGLDKIQGYYFGKPMKAKDFYQQFIQKNVDN